MPDLKDLILERQQQLNAAEAEVLRLRRELQEAKQLLLGNASLGPLPAASSSTAPGNSTELAEAVLRKQGDSMHVNDIISAIEREYQVTVRYATLVGNLSRLVSKGKIFERTGPNRFGLLEWYEQREAEELFGREQRELEGER